MEYASSFGNAVFEFTAFVNSPRAADFASRKAGVRLTGMQVATIWHVARDPGIKPSRLAQRVGVEPAVMSKMCSRLVELEILESHVNSADHRVKELSVGPEGVTLVRAIFAVGNEIVDRALAEFSEDEVEIAQRVFERLVSVVKAPESEEYLTERFP